MKKISAALALSAGVLVSATVAAPAQAADPNYCDYG